MSAADGRCGRGARGGAGSAAVLWKPHTHATVPRCLSKSMCEVGSESPLREPRRRAGFILRLCGSIEGRSNACMDCGHVWVCKRAALRPMACDGSVPVRSRYWFLSLHKAYVAVRNKRRPL